MKHFVIFIVAVLTFISLTNSLFAEPITIEITAEVAYVDDPNNCLGGAISVGDTLTGSYTYESTVLDSNPIPTVGDYGHSTPPFGIRVTGGGFIFETDPDNVEFLVEICDNHGNPSSDNYLLRSYNNLPLSNGASVLHISWQLDDPICTALSSEALPTVPPVLTDWQSVFGLSIEGSCCHDLRCDFPEFFIRAHVTSAIPAPAATVNIDLPAGWSMISLPVVPTDKKLKMLFPGAMVVYGYEKGTGYVQIGNEDDLEVGRGYWILLGQEKNYTLTGYPIPSYAHQASSDGWAMIGGCTDPSQVIPYGCDIGAIYGFARETGYQQVLASECLEPGKGYWILLKNVAGQATITVEIEF